jgi:1,4-alpha-glucan branching enzyme
LLEQDPKHGQLQGCVRRLNQLYNEESAFHEEEYSWEGFQWIDLHDYERSILSFLRRSPSRNENLLVVLNFTPVVRYNYRLGVPQPGIYREVFNSDASEFGGSNVINTPQQSIDLPWHEQLQSIEITLPPLAAVIFKRTTDE